MGSFSGEPLLLLDQTFSWFGWQSLELGALGDKEFLSTLVFELSCSSSWKGLPELGNSASCTALALVGIKQAYLLCNSLGYKLWTACNVRVWCLELALWFLSEFSSRLCSGLDHELGRCMFRPTLSTLGFLVVHTHGIGERTVKTLSGLVLFSCIFSHWLASPHQTFMKAHIVSPLGTTTTTITVSNNSSVFRG